MAAMNMRKLTDINGNDITAQQAYDAAMSGPVYVFADNTAEGNYSADLFVALDLYIVIRENENIVSTSFLGTYEMTKYIFYAGEKPNI